MRCLIFFALLSFNVLVQAKTNAKVYYESIPNGYALFVDNYEYCPVSVVIQFNLDNLKASTNRQSIFIIPPKQSRYKITELKAIRGGKYGFSYKNKIYLGNIKINSYDINFIYDLPFAKGEAFRIDQAYNGSTTHKNINALDFGLPLGTPVYAVRAGIAIKVIDGFNKRCNRSDCAKYNNFILILHSDGTFANYSHLKQISALIKEGEAIKKGQQLALSGETGWTSGPHLHLEIYLAKANKRRTLQTKFKIGDGKKAVFLEEKQLYKKEY